VAERVRGQRHDHQRRTSTINGWALTFTFPGDQRITSAWNGTVTQSGQTVTATNASYNAAITPGASTSLGFQGTWTSSDSPPPHTHCS
jgi:cellulase/cellobiase CelA1